MGERWALSEGLRLRYYTEGDRGPWLVFIHGLGSSLETWRLVWRELLNRGDYRLLGLDLRGFGRSEKPPMVPGLDDFATDVRSVVEDAGAEKPVVIGSSMGGMVAARYAAKHPGDVSGLVLSNTASRVRVDTDLMKRALEGDEEALSRIAARVSRRLSTSPPSLLKSFFTGDPNYVLEVAQRLMGEDISLDLAWVRVPVLVIAGEEDPVTPVEEAERLVSLVERGVLRVLGGARHLSHIDSPREYAKLVHWFVGELGVG